MDKMHLTGIRAYGYLGALPEEKILGQWFEVDLTLWLDLTPSGESDRLQDTIDYCDVIEMVQAQIKTAPYLLLEKMATVLADKILMIERILEVEVRLTKPTPPIADFSGKVAIELRRSKALH
jgi:dihydroneopterin aldolase